MTKTRILYVTSEMDPYIELSKIAEVSRRLPPAMQEKGMEIRVLMPRYGLINERKHRLHEVVRLSGINVMVGDSDNPLIIKVASIPQAKMQVYFLDNEDFFQRKYSFRDDKGSFFPDNHERITFFCKGVVEMVKKLGWAPDIIHCQGWMTSLIPIYIKKLHNNDPIYQHAKVIYSVYDNYFDETLNNDFINISVYDDMENADLKLFAEGTNKALDKGGMEFADAVVVSGQNLHPEVDAHLKGITGKTIMEHTESEEMAQLYLDFYQKLLAEQAVDIS